MIDFVPRKLTEDEIAVNFPEMMGFKQIIEKLGATLAMNVWQTGPKDFKVHHTVSGSPELLERLKIKLVEAVEALPIPVELEIIDER